MLNQINEAYAVLKDWKNKTPVMTSRSLNNKTNCEIYFKCENFQRAGAFKFRGAFNAINNLSEDDKKRGIVTHSSGNHAQAVALVGKLLGIKTTIVMPENAPSVKVSATRDYGAEIVFSKSNIVSREKTCNKLIKDHGYTLIHPYDNDNVIFGAATVAKELTEEVGKLDYIIAPTGGGGLLSGTSIYSKLSKTISYVIGAEPKNADDAYRSFKSNTLVKSHNPNTIADGLRTLLSERTFNYINKYVDDIITVSEIEIIAAMKFIWERMKIIIEPSSSTVLAALLNGIEINKIKKGSKVGLILSGGNIDLSEFFNKLELQITD